MVAQGPDSPLAPLPPVRHDRYLLSITFTLLAKLCRLVTAFSADLLSLTVKTSFCLKLAWFAAALGRSSAMIFSAMRSTWSKRFSIARNLWWLYRQTENWKAMHANRHTTVKKFNKARNRSGLEEDGIDSCTISRHLDPVFGMCRSVTFFDTCVQKPRQFVHTGWSALNWNEFVIDL